MNDWKPEIIRTADRLPTKEDGRVLYWEPAEKAWYCGHCEDVSYYKSPYWMKAPPDPEPKEPWREAYDNVTPGNFWKEEVYRAGWDAAIEAVLSRSASVCHDTLRQLKSK